MLVTDNAQPRIRALPYYTTFVFLALLTATSAAKSEPPDRAARNATVTNRAAADIARSLAVPPGQVDTNARLRVFAGGRALKLDEARSDIVIPNAVLAERTGDRVRTLPATDDSTRALSAAPVAAYALPISFRALAQLPGTAAPRPLSFEAVVLVLNGLRFQETTHRFEAELAIGLRNPQAPTDRSVLNEAVKLLIRADAADDVSPRDINISRLGDPQIVRIAAHAPTAPFMVSARTLLDDGDNIEVPVERPALKIQPARPVIEGWGLAKTILQIEASGLQNAANLSIDLSTTQGQITPTPVVLGANGHATAELRSDGVGTAKVSASGNPFRPADSEVRFATPWRFLVASLIGALAGWVARTRARSHSVRSMLLALVSAAILSSAYAIGIRWFEWAPEATVGEALAFFVAALGAYTGVSVLNPKKA